MPETLPQLQDEVRDLVRNIVTGVLDDAGRVPPLPEREPPPRSTGGVATIAVGSDADIVIFDPDAEWTKSVTQHHMDVDYSPYEGKEVKGKVDTVLLRGDVIVDRDEYLGTKGDGEYVPRARVSVDH